MGGLLDRAAHGLAFCACPVGRGTELPAAESEAVGVLWYWRTMVSTAVREQGRGASCGIVTARGPTHGLVRLQPKVDRGGVRPVAAEGEAVGASRASGRQWPILLSPAGRDVSWLAESEAPGRLRHPAALHGLGLFACGPWRIMVADGGAESEAASGMWC